MSPIFRLPPFQTLLVSAVSLTETIDWGLALARIPEAWAKTRGAGVRVAILDTGLAIHPDLAGGVLDAKSFVGGDYYDRSGHGTHCAGIVGARQDGQGVVGVAPLCDLLIGKVLDDSGSGLGAGIAAGIRWAMSAGADVISMSLGSPQDDPQIVRAIRDATAAGCFVIAAAGNSGRRDDVNSPGRLPETIAVGAHDRNGRPAEFSSRGPQIDISAPGVDILSTHLNRGYARLSGTSMATPFVAGVTALVLALHRQTERAKTPLRNVQDLREHLRRTARDAGTPGHDDETGFGLIDPLAALIDAGQRGELDGPKPAIDFAGAVTINGQPFKLLLEPMAP